MLVQLTSKLYAYHKRLGQNRAAYALIATDPELVPAVYSGGHNPPAWANKIMRLGITGGHIELTPGSFAHVLFAAYEGEFQDSTYCDPRANSVLSHLMREGDLLNCVQSRYPQFSLIRGIEASAPSLRSYLEWRFMN